MGRNLSPQRVSLWKPLYNFHRYSTRHGDSLRFPCGKVEFLVLLFVVKSHEALPPSSVPSGGVDLPQMPGQTGQNSGCPPQCVGDLPTKPNWLRLENYLLVSNKWEIINCQSNLLQRIWYGARHEFVVYFSPYNVNDLLKAIRGQLL